MSDRTRPAVLEARSSIPLYQQLAADLSRLITAGELQAGDRIASEAALVAQYGVSRITVRAAVRDLVEAGSLVRKQGKGTFVCVPKFERKIEYVLGFTAACRANGLAAASRRVGPARLLADYRDVRGQLGIRADDQILHLQRVRSADGRPLMLENNYFSNARYGFLAGEPLAGSLYQLLEARCAVTPGSAPGTTVEMVRAARDMAALLETKSGEPLFLIRALIRDQRGEPLHVAEHFALADRYCLTF